MAIEEAFDYYDIDNFRVIDTFDSMELYKSAAALNITPAQCTDVNDVLTRIDELSLEVMRGSGNSHDMALNIVDGDDLAYSIDILETNVGEASDFRDNYINLRRKLGNLLPSSAAENDGVTDNMREQITDIWDDVTYNEDNIVKYVTLLDDWWYKHADEISRLADQES